MEIKIMLQTINNIIYENYIFVIFGSIFLVFAFFGSIFLFLNNKNH